MLLEAGNQDRRKSSTPQIFQEESFLQQPLDTMFEQTREPNALTMYLKNGG